GLPVPLRPEAIAVSHQALHSQPGQLPQPTEVFERVGEGPKTALFQERAHAPFLLRPVTQGLVPLPTSPQFRSHIVELFILGHQRINIRLRGRLYPLNQVVNAPRVYRHTKAQFRLGLISFSNGNIAHIVTKTRQLQILDGVPSRSRPRPSPDALI